MVQPAGTTTSSTSFTSARRRRAVVVGGGIAGLWAARVLADHFGEVILLERDRLPEGPEPRKGVPQARHIHLLLARGQRILEQLFPGLDAELAAAGAPAVSWTADVAIHDRSRWHRRYSSDLVCRTCSRDLLEWHLRRRLRACSNLEIRDGTAATGLLSSADGTVVTGVLAQRPGEPLAADLVVDASGRASHAPGWLAELGHERPEEEIIRSHLTYVSRWYRRPADFDADWKALVVAGEAPHLPYGGALFPVEGDRWIVLVGVVMRQAPRPDEVDFPALTRRLGTLDIHGAIQGAEPLTPVYIYRRTENRLRHFERMSRWPEGFVVLGDAACTFNPIYGQGMTVSGMGALELDRCLREQRGGNLRGLARTFQRRLARINATPWLMATGEDLRWPETEGSQLGPTTRLVQRYINQVLLAASDDICVSLAFRQVQHLLEPAVTLFHPHIIARVLARKLSLRSRARRGAAPRGPAAPPRSSLSSPE